MQTRPETIYRFGPFEFHSASLELFRNNARVRLQEQPSLLLLALLEQAGQIVSHEQLRTHLWKEDTFVKFDDGLRVAVRKLRESLGDGADHPRYVETVTKRGYRFVAHELERGARHTNAAVWVPTAAPLANGIVAEPVLSVRKRTLPAWAWAGGLVLIGCAVATIFVLRSGRKVLAATDTIVLAAFTNETGDAVFDGTLRQGLAVQLGQSTFLKIISDQQMEHTLTLMGKPANAQLAPELAREICERAGSAEVIDGTIKLLGGRYVLGLRARNCHNGDVVSEQQVQVDRKEEVLNTLGTTSTQLRKHVGESLAQLGNHDTPLAEAATSSLEALKAYTTGITVLHSDGDGAAIPFFKRASEIDPQFAAAFAQLALTYGSIGESALSAASNARAYELKDRASEAERYLIVATYEMLETGNLEKARETCVAWATAYPRELVPHAYLSGAILPAFASYDQSGTEASWVIKQDPNFSIGYTLLAFSLISRNRYDEAEQIITRARSLGLETFFTNSIRYDLAFLRNRPEEMRQISASKSAATDDLLLVHEAFSLAYTGRLAESKGVLRHATDLAQQVARRDTAALYQAGEAVGEAFAGDVPAARASALAALRMSNQRDVEYGAAFALGMIGDDQRAQTLTDDLERRFPEDTSVRFSYVPELRAMAAIHGGHPEAAIVLLQPGERYDLGMQGSTSHIPMGAMYAVYMRGQAYLALQRGPEAAAEFQRILNHPGIVINDPIGAIARLQLARSYALSGDSQRARAAYQDFLKLWNNADAGLPTLQQARREYIQAG